MTFMADIHGITLAIESQDQGLLAFAREYFRGFGEAKDPAMIQCKIHFASGYSFELHDRHTNKLHTLGSGIFWDQQNRTIHISERGWNYSITETDGKYIAQLSFRKNAWRHLLHILSVGHRETQRRYYRAAIRILPQILLFQSLAIKGIHPHSGAAVSLGGKAYVFAGLPGSGKSTLVHTLRTERAAEILTENFVLTDGISVYPFPEGNPLASMKAIPITGVYALSHAETFSVAEITRETMHNLTQMIDTLTAELPEHAKIAALAFVSNTPLLKSTPYSAPAHTLVTDRGMNETKKYFVSL